MTIGERVKILRKEKCLSMEDFGAIIGMGKSAVSRIENGVNGTTDQTIRSICREFGVNEQWLRTGEGEMFEQTRESVLDRLAAEYSLDKEQVSVIEAFLDLDAKDREAVLKYFHKVLDRISPAAQPPRRVNVPDDVAAAVVNVQDEVARYNAEQADEAASGGKESSFTG